MIFTVFIFIGILGALVLVHELGHFLMAKRAGIRVEEFGIGFPPRIIGRRVGETLYSLNIVPLGGFVRIFGEEGEGRGDPRSFVSKPVPVRLSILLAGVVMNFLFASLLFSFNFSQGLPTTYDEELLDSHAEYRDIKVQIVGVRPESPAEEAGIQMGDTVREVSGRDGFSVRISTAEDLISTVDMHLGEEIRLHLSRGKEEFSVLVVPRLSPPEGEGAMGVLLERTALVSYPWYLALFKGIEFSFKVLSTIISAFWAMFADFVMRGVISPDAAAGPVGIAVLTSRFAKLGFFYLVQFTALLSLNLAIINAIPFPALDGGRAFFVIIETIKGSPLSAKFERRAHAVGFAILILLIVLITIKDIARYL